MTLSCALPVFRCVLVSTSVVMVFWVLCLRQSCRDLNLNFWCLNFMTSRTIKNQRLIHSATGPLRSQQNKLFYKHNSTRRAPEEHPTGTAAQEERQSTRRAPRAHEEYPNSTRRAQEEHHSTRRAPRAREEHHQSTRRAPEGSTGRAPEDHQNNVRRSAKQRTKSARRGTRKTQEHRKNARTHEEHQEHE